MIQLPDDGPPPDVLVRAQGIVLAMLEGVLIARGVLQTGELSGHLGAMAEIMKGPDPACAALISSWGAMLAEVEAEAQGQQH